MGSKSPEDEGRRHHDDHFNSSGGNARKGGGEARGSHLSRDGDGCLGNGGGDEGESDGDDDDEVHETGVGAVNGNEEGAEVLSAAQKKRKKANKKKKKKKKGKSQTSPPRIPLAELFPSGVFPGGEMQFYTRSATDTAEARHDAIRKHTSEDPEENDGFLRDYRKAAEVHRQTSRWVHETVKPGQSLLSIAEGIEDSVRALLGNAGLEPGDSLKSGLGFPTGLCLNEGTAHYTPNPGDKEVILKHEDVMKVDYGVHINGWIVDSAFTLAFDPMYDNLLTAVKAATNEGIKAAGVDVRICDVSEVIQETMESYEVEINGKTQRVNAVRNINAHNINRWHIHGGKSIPFIRNKDQTKMEDGEVFAIETFGTTGRGYLRDDAGIYGYGLIEDAPLRQNLPLNTAKRLHKTIRENFGTLVFCRRYLDRLGMDRYLAGMNCLISNGIVETHEPLTDLRGSHSAQFEHTILLRETHKEVLSRGDDY